PPLSRTLCPSSGRRRTAASGPGRTAAAMVGGEETVTALARTAFRTLTAGRARGGARDPHQLELVSWDAIARSFDPRHPGRFSVRRAGPSSKTWALAGGSTRPRVL